MKICFVVNDIPPKKDGANSMWKKRSEIPRLISLRKAAFEKLEGLTFFDKPIKLTLRVFAQANEGDLDNFVTGVCDGLMAVHPSTLNHLDLKVWEVLPEGARPDKPIAYRDDQIITKIEAERFKPKPEFPYYEVELEWI